MGKKIQFLGEVKRDNFGFLVVNFHFVLGGEFSQVCKLMLEDGLVCREGQAWYLMEVWGTNYSTTVDLRSIVSSMLR